MLQIPSKCGSHSKPVLEKVNVEGVASCRLTELAASAAPHIIHILADDLGWSEVGPDVVGDVSARDSEAVSCAKATPKGLICQDIIGRRATQMCRRLTSTSWPGWSLHYWSFGSQVDLDCVRSGIELDRFYTFQFCSPARSAIQSGRNPIHVNVQNVPPEYVSPGKELRSFSLT